MIDETPAVIILNTQLPRMSGYHVCSIIRKNLHFSQIPIIMHSDKEDLFDKVRSRLAGATDYLTSPLDSSELIETVKKYLRNGPEAML
jgi:twitching motility two-component system response regulator PilG